jgi:hypothetical protein
MFPVLRDARAAALAGAVVLALSLAACGADDGGSSGTGTGPTATSGEIPTAATSTVDASKMDDYFFAQFAKAREDQGDGPELIACVVAEVRKVATRAELDEVEAGGSSLPLARKAHKALVGCKAPAT